MRRTKIVCTIGPASSSVADLDRLAAAGMDVARLNFSHGTHAEHAEVLRRIREGEERWGRPIAILQDLQGPKIRLGTFGEGGGRRVDLEPGRTFALCRRPCVGTVERAYVAPPESLDGVKVGDQVLMDDGNDPAHGSRRSRRTRCAAASIAGGRISDHKGLSLPRVPLPISCLTDKDREDLRFGIQHGVDFVAISFVRTAADIAEARKFLGEHGADIPLVAKLERQEVMANLPDILAAVDAVMVARGDLGVDVPLEDVPHLQQEIIRQARAAKVPVIVATQMLESMVTHLRPDAGRGVRRGHRDLRGRRRDHAVGRDRHRPLPGRGRRGDGAHRHVAPSSRCWPRRRSAGGARMPRSASASPRPCPMPPPWRPTRSTPGPSSPSRNRGSRRA